MFPGIALVEKIVIFGIDMFVAESARADAMKQNVRNYFSSSGRDAQKSAKMRLEYQQLREDEGKLWPKDKN